MMAVASSQRSDRTPTTSGASAVKIIENSEGIEPGVYFRIALGGVTGHQTFASDWGVLVKPEQLNDVMVALLRVFIQFGDRTNRKKARFKYVIEDKGLDGVLVEAEKLLKLSYPPRTHGTVSS